MLLKMKTITYSFATDKDIQAIKTLLQESHLPYKDIDGHIDNFIVAKEQGALIASIGLEVLQPYSLLRSLTVSENYRNKGIANELLKKISEYALSIHIKDLFLLTTTAEDYFMKNKFIVLERNDLPDPLKKTQEFIFLCPETAICMYKKIN